MERKEIIQKAAYENSTEWHQIKAERDLPKNTGTF